jgi:hypothetical protein
MKKFIILFWIFFILITYTNAQSYVPITVTGFNADLIANGTGTVTGSTTNGFDSDASEGNNYYVAGYLTGTRGLPANGIINSVSTSGVTYQLANYTGNNALLLVSLNQVGTLTFSNPGSFSSLSICAASAGTPNTSTSFTARVNFSDGSFTDYSFSVPDWFDGGTYAITGVDRVSRSGSFQGITNNPKLFDCLINLSSDDQVKVVNSIRFTKTVSNDRTGIFAVCGVTAVGAPLAPTATSATSVQGTSFMANWNANPGGFAPISYLLDVATNNTFSNLVSGYNNLNVGLVSSYSVTGLSTSTTYYYRVRATNAAGTGPNSNIISVTTINPIPSDPSSITASINPTCSGSATQLTATGAQGTVFWYTGSCGGTQLITGNPITVSPAATTTYYARNYDNSQFSAACASVTITVNPLLQYRTVQSGTWTTLANWLQYNGSSWVAATSYPGEISNACDNPLVTIQTGHQMEIQSENNINIPNLKIEGTGKLTIQSGGKIYVQDQLQLDENAGGAIVVEE